MSALCLCVERAYERKGSEIEGLIEKAVPSRMCGLIPQFNPHRYARFIFTPVGSLFPESIHPRTVQLVWRQWTIGDVVEVLNEYDKPSSLLEENPPELAWYVTC